jgi:hypothetical protein
MWHGLSLFFGGLAALALLLGLIPLLGWTNWILTLPLGVVGLVLAAVGRSRQGQVLNVAILGLAALRLFLGGGLL